jgi:hypothetical protein
MWYTHKEQPLRFGLWTVLNGVLPIPFLVIYYGMLFSLLILNKAEECFKRPRTCNPCTIGTLASDISPYRYDQLLLWNPSDMCPGDS